jgi:hypothetical protein
MFTSQVQEIAWALVARCEIDYLGEDLDGDVVSSPYDQVEVVTENVYCRIA